MRQEKPFEISAALQRRSVQLSSLTEQFLRESSSQLNQAAAIIIETLRAGHTILLCGNGGSAAHAIHLEAELVVRYRVERGPLPAVYLGLSPSSSTAIANDYSAALIFARPLEALAKPGDLLLGFSTSGTSVNVLKAFQLARLKQIASILVSGSNASEDVADLVLRFPGATPDNIQDGHSLIIHAFMDAVDTEFSDPSDW